MKKGANQAVAASRSGAETVLLGNVGADEFGQKILNSLKKDRLGLQFIAVEKNQATGIALVTKYEKDNNIIVIPGANTASDICYIQKNRQVISNAKIQVSCTPINLLYGSSKKVRFAPLLAVGVNENRGTALSPKTRSQIFQASNLG